MKIQSQTGDCDIRYLARISSVSLSVVLPWLMVGCGAILWLIWPVIHTIAFRNVLLFTGGLMGLWYLVQERRDLYQVQALPLLFVILLFIWVGIHHLFFTHNPNLEFEQIKGTWLRTLLACLLGVGIGLHSRHHLHAQHIVWVGIFFFPILFYINYIWISLTIDSWRIPYPYELGFYANKISIVFYGIILYALGCSLISYIFIGRHNHYRPYLLGSAFFMVSTFIAFIFVGTKSGVAQALILTFGLFVIFLFKVKKSVKNVLIMSLCIGIVCVMTYLHLKISPEWNNFIPTVSAGFQIDKYPNWRDEDAYGLPKLSDGTAVPESAYVRTAFATEGVRLLYENPMGYGLVDESFKYLTREDLPDSSSLSLTSTLSGWLDFSLGFGIPGLFLTWTAIVLAITFSYHQTSLWSHCTRWILVATFLSWLFAELSGKHFIETLFYLISLFSAGNIPITKDKRLGSS